MSCSFLKCLCSIPFLSQVACALSVWLSLGSVQGRHLSHLELPFPSIPWVLLVKLARQTQPFLQHGCSFPGNLNISSSPAFY